MSEKADTPTPGECLTCGGYEHLADAKCSRPWFVHYICCGRQWSEAQSFPTWEEADQHREWYVEQPMPGHDRVAIVSRDPQAYGWPA